jgi:transcriptional regulator with PAS, ATPase and Fis domain
VGSHDLVQQVREFVDQVASVAQVTALLLGESGTGKNMVARAIHGASLQAHMRFVEVNCAALPASLLEAELFGYEKGAFTDARQMKKGLVEVAEGGTLFLDEIGSMPLELQAKLLTFLESRSFRRIGSTREQQVSVRVIAATNVDLAGEVARGNFREDLYYRLNVASKVLPPLRAIKSDIPAIARHFVKRAAEYFAKPVPEIEAESLERLKRYDWPGNARELRNVIERSMIFSRDHVLRMPELTSPSSAPAAPPNSVPIPRGLTLEEVERMYIEATLADVGGSINAAAARLGVSRKVLWQRRKRHGMVA